MPAPSPVLTSLPVAPRCSRLHRAPMPVRTMSWLRRPFMSTTNDTPQASCSKAGSYRPWAAGRSWNIVILGSVSGAVGWPLAGTTLARCRSPRIGDPRPGSEPSFRGGGDAGFGGPGAPRPNWAIRPGCGPLARSVAERGDEEGPGDRVEPEVEADEGGGGLGVGAELVEVHGVHGEHVAVGLVARRGRRPTEVAGAEVVD